MDPTTIIFIALAAFIAYRLYSVLGARTGEERSREIDRLASKARDENGDAKPAEPEPVRPLPPVSAAAEPLRAGDPEFDERVFLDGAESAYEMIVEAFSSGDLKSIRRFINPSVFDAFKAAVADRESAKQRAELKFVGIEKTSIESSRVENGEMIAVVDFISNQVRATYDDKGGLVSGDPNRIDLVHDRWTFSHPLKASDPNWMLIATGGV